MNFLNEAEQLFVALADRFNDPELTLTQGTCRAEFDGYSLTFNYDDVLKAMFIKASLCPLSALPDQDQALITILEATYEWASLLGGSFGLDDDEEFIFYRARLDLWRSEAPLDKNLLVNLVHTIIGALDWAVGALGLANGENSAQ
ncbi:MAG: type III secretion system chaperone [Deltaproteobacteria bacterium]|jgi:hypothetical protein|nr:type III secretion system chaperone [Deltaproteobacteria bacterium]